MRLLYILLISLFLSTSLFSAGSISPIPSLNIDAKRLLTSSSTPPTTPATIESENDCSYNPNLQNLVPAPFVSYRCSNKSVYTLNRTEQSTNKYYHYFNSTVTATVDYECKEIIRNNFETPPCSNNMRYDSTKCECVPTCTVPSDKVILESYTDSIQCQSDLNNFTASLTDNTGAVGGTAPICTGCFDSAGNWSGGIYYKPPTSCTDNGTFKENNTFSSPYVYCSSGPQKDCDNGYTYSEDTHKCERDEIEIQYPLPLSYSDCMDSVGGTVVFENKVYSEINWHDLSCQGSFLRYLNCNEITTQFENSCDLSKNIPNFSCTDGTPPIVTSSCKPKVSPCDTLEKEYRENCDEYETIIGDCKDDGSVVNSQSFECTSTLPPKEDCTYKWHEKLNSITNKCECEDDYTRNKWDECWENLDINASDEEINDDLKAQEESGKEKLKDDEDKNLTKSSANDSNELLEGIRTDINGTNTLLDGIRGDLNGTNNLLGEILDELKDKNGSSDSNTSSDSNETDCTQEETFKEMLACYGEDFFEKDFMDAPDGWYEENKIVLDIGGLGGGCQLETFKWTQSGKNLEFPPRDFIESLPLELIASFFMAILYISGLRDFLRS